MTSQVIVSIGEFKNEFPEFENSSLNMNIYLKRAQRYISKYNSYNLRDENRKLAIYLMTAHLLTLQEKINAGDTSSNAIASTSIDKVSVSLIPPPNKTQFEYWLNQTPQYGGELLSLLEISHPVPIYIGGSFNRVLQ